MTSLQYLMFCLISGSMSLGQTSPLNSVTGDLNPEQDIGQQPMFEDLKSGSYMVINSSMENTTRCQLFPRDKSFNEKVMEAVNVGNRLITFTLNFKDYDQNPLLMNMSNNYKSNHWYRTYDLHAYTLLSFPFNYKVLSLSTLAHGTTEMAVEMEDYPKGCLGTLDTVNKLTAAARIVAIDFDAKKSSMFGKEPHACHRFVKHENGFGVFEFRCCRVRGDDGKLECNQHKAALWVRELYKYITGLQVVAFLTGPLFLGGLFFSMSLRQRGYEVKLDEPIKGTLTVENKSSNGAVGSGGDFKQFKSAIQRPQLLEKCLTQSNSRGRSILIKRLMLLVDERSLILESAVPVGVFRFIYHDIFFCGIKKWEPFASLFNASLLGPFRSFGLKYLTWGTVMTVIGATAGVIFLPFPFYIRLAAYYGFEANEIKDRSSLLAELGLERKYEHNLLYYLSPSHPLFIVVFAVYFLALPMLMLLRLFDPELFQKVTIGAFRDLQEVFRMEAIRLFFTYLFLPLEKWGVFGLLIGVLYWPFAIPIVFVISVIYCIPTFYLTCRFLVLQRPSFLSKNCSRCPVSDAVENLHVSRFPRYSSLVNYIDATGANKVKSLEDSLLLNNISPKLSEDAWMQEESHGRCVILLKCVLRVCTGLTCIALMYSVLAIFSEAVGFFIEVIIFTIMGAIVNANSSAKFIAVAFMLIAYCSSCFSSLHSKYRLLNEMIFKQIKDKLHSRIRDCTKQRLDMQISSAFKYLNLEEERELQKAYLENTRLKSGDPKLNVDFSSIYDHLESKNGKLYWKVNSLVMFVDRRDSPRIPMELFLRVSDAEGVPDNPGSIPVNMVMAFRQLLYMLIFLSFVVLVVVTFHQVYLMSTTNQLLLTLGGGLVPLLIKNFMTPAATTKSYADKGFINYAFEGCVNEIVEDFQQTWPVFDLDFEYEDEILENDEAQDDLNEKSEASFRPPQIHLRFNLAKDRPTIKSLTGAYDEPFDQDSESMPLRSISDVEGETSKAGVKIVQGVEALKVHDTEVTIDLFDGKCGVRDLHYL